MHDEKLCLGSWKKGFSRSFRRTNLRRTACFETGWTPFACFCPIFPSRLKHTRNWSWLPYSSFEVQFAETLAIFSRSSVSSWLDLTKWCAPFIPLVLFGSNRLLRLRSGMSQQQMPFTRSTNQTWRKWRRLRRWLEACLGKWRTMWGSNAIFFSVKICLTSLNYFRLLRFLGQELSLVVGRSRSCGKFPSKLRIWKLRRKSNPRLNFRLVMLFERFAEVEWVCSKVRFSGFRV